ncbi:MAG: DUF2130 domain-containing protein [Acidobacteriota bacterium]|nr:DUF2130 domain-containing protein [Acidobacteriota bacterium]MDQ2844348.1 DUF2130 domain-containing protein [Acidobacteriota bacterium]
MAEPTVACPNCKTEIKLTESLAAPLVEATRRDYERRLAQKDTECNQREVALRNQESLFAKQKEAFAAQIQEKLEQEREKICAEESRKAKAICALELDGKVREIHSLHDVLRQREDKLVEAQRIQAQFLQKQRALEDEKRELDLTIEKRVREELAVVRAQARVEAEDQLKLKVIEKEQTIASMQKQIEDLRRRAEQGSQQLQGEAQELELEALLSSKFPFDGINPVRKGEHGGDVLHRVQNSQGGCCGTILWETKRTKNWSDSWLVKLREDQRAAKAEIAIIVSHALPKDIDTFELVEGVWITHPKTMIPVAFSLRHMLIELACVRQASEGQQTKAEMVYQYLTGPRFRHRIEATVEAFSGMQKDLENERKVITRQWAKRQQQIDTVMQATAGMYGDLQGIAGKTIQEIDGLAIEALPLIA